MKESDIARIWTRSHAVILSSNGYSIEEISKIYEVDRDTISSWLKRWEEQSFNGLYDEEKSGRPPEVFSDIKILYINMVLVIDNIFLKYLD